MKGGAHQSLLTLMRTLVCLHKEGVGLAICDRGICFCMGKGLEAGKRKDRDRMEDCYDFERNRRVMLEIDSGIEISKSKNEVWCKLLSNTWYTNLLWGRGQSCLCRKISTPARKIWLSWFPGTLPPSFLAIPPLPRAPCPPFGISPGPPCIFSLLFCATTAIRRGLALPIDGLPIVIIFQSPILITNH